MKATSPLGSYADRGLVAAFWVVLAGICVALHIGKLPPALPVLRVDLHVTLVQAGFLLSMVQLAGMTLGLAVGLFADVLGLKRCMLFGLVLLGFASALGASAQTPATLLLTRFFEGLGFLLCAMPAPSLLRQLVSPRDLSKTLGWWAAYMPIGAALALWVGPWVIGASSWSMWWLLLSGVTFLSAWGLYKGVPSRAWLEARSETGQSVSGSAPAAWGRWPPPNSPTPSFTPFTPFTPFNPETFGVGARLKRTLSVRGPWLIAVCFGVYSGQWIAVIGFLPTITTELGNTAFTAGWVSALVALVNMVGNVGSGIILARKATHDGPVPGAEFAPTLLWIGYSSMAIGAVMAYAQIDGVNLPVAVRLGGVLLFSALGGLVPGTLFALAVRLSPARECVAITVGWMQQWSSMGQFVGPPLVAWAAAVSGGWQWTWVVTGVLCLLGMVGATQVSVELAKVERARALL